MFFEPVAAAASRRLISSALTVSGIEISPKQDRLQTDRRIGNLVRGPLGIHRLTGRRYPFVDPVSLQPVAQTPEGTIDYLGSKLPTPITEVKEHLARLPDHAKGAAPLSARSVSLSRSASTAEVTKHRLGDVYDFISRYVPLDETGRGPCPFHPPDRHSSFAVNRQQGYWICFHEVNPRTGRHLGGDIIAFWMKFRDLSFQEALRDLYWLQHASGTP